MIKIYFKTSAGIVRANLVITKEKVEGPSYSWDKKKIDALIYKLEMDEKNKKIYNNSIWGCYILSNINKDYPFENYVGNCYSTDMSIKEIEEHLRKNLKEEKAFGVFSFDDFEGTDGEVLFYLDE